MIRSGKGKNRAEEFKNQGIIAIGWNAIDISKYSNYSLLREAVSRHYDKILPKIVQTKNTKELLDFAYTILPGDYIITSNAQKDLYIGQVTGGYSYQSGYRFDDIDKHASSRTVKWHPLPILRKKLSKEAQKKLNLIKTVFKLPEFVEEELLSFINKSSDNIPYANHQQNIAHNDTLSEEKNYLPLNTLEEDVKAILANKNIPLTEQLNLIKQRLGQGKFRENVIKISGGTCRVTGINNPDLLIASHIKPWCKSQDTPDERLDEYNGLLLAPHVDKLFDRGLISFEDNGDMLVSETVKEIMQQWNISNKNVGAFPPEQTKYLKWHRENHYKGNSPK